MLLYSTEHYRIKVIPNHCDCNCESKIVSRVYPQSDTGFNPSSYSKFANLPYRFVNVITTLFSDLPGPGDNKRSLRFQLATCLPHIVEAFSLPKAN